jgi:hypothetical protein
MWWQPETEAEGAIARFLARLVERFDADSAPPFQGIGSTLHGKCRAPLVVLDRRFVVDPIKAETDAFLGEIEDYFRLILATFGFPIEPFDRDDVFYPLSDAGENALRLLAPFDPPDNTLVAFAARPKALNATPGLRVYGPDSKDATIGFVLDVGGTICATTAGHFVTRMPCEVSTREPLLFGWLDRVARIGQVRFYNDPLAAPGPDVALIDLDCVGSAPVQPYAVVLPQSLPRHATVKLRGARSGAARGWVVSDMLRTIEEDGRIWTNAWWVNHFDSGFGQEGDSGGRVALEGNELVLGHLVGSVGVLGRKGQRQMGIVQEMATILDYIKEKTGAGKDHARPATFERSTGKISGGIGRVKVPNLLGETVEEAREKLFAIDKVCIGPLEIKVRVDRAPLLNLMVKPSNNRGRMICRQFPARGCKLPMNETVYVESGDKFKLDSVGPEVEEALARAVAELNGTVYVEPGEKLDSLSPDVEEALARAVAEFVEPLDDKLDSLSPDVEEARARAVAEFNKAPPPRKD